MSLKGCRFLITSGPTRAPLDAVRYITNKSSGRLGAYIAEEALQRGASVTFVYGRPSAVPVVRGGYRDHLFLIAIETVEDLIRAFQQELPGGRYDAVIHLMAVLDFAPAEVSQEKTTSDLQEWVVRLVPTPKAIKLVKELAPETFLVGFKLEVGKPIEELVAIAYDSLKRNRCDLVVANDLREIEAGRHTGYFVTPEGTVARVVVGKEAIAKALLDYIEEKLTTKRLTQGEG
ncbi:MAG: phosphopantothenoylcysteine decarboxylase [Armatimonadota bacterium]|nr:phosphopantothenoylcysteine decarboxylase [Armatimonadota bacterium]